MPEAEPSPEAREMVSPSYIGAVFETGRSLSLVRDWVTGEWLVPEPLDVKKKEDRDRWCLENLRVFSDGTLPSPEWKWKPVVDFWLTELKTAASRSELARDELRETEKKIKAMMAVSASARAMEMTAGSAEKYVNYITGGDGDLDKQDYWEEFLLNNDYDKLNLVFADPLVKHYYERIKKDAGTENVQEWRKEKDKKGEWQTVPSSWETNKEAALQGKLVEYLRAKGGKGYKGGFNEYIADFLLAEDSKEFISEQLGKGLGNSCRWAAARLACDAFLVDKYTRWEFEVSPENYEKDPENKLKLKPFPGWGGDPLRALLEPSFLPRRIKKTYQGEHEQEILNMMDKAFRPEDIFSKNEELKREELPVSMVVHLKQYARYNAALWSFLGGSRAPAIPQWTKDTITKDLPAMAELLDQVYGVTINKPESNTGKHVVGAMMARILQCKALATALESARPGFGDKISSLFGVETARPFLEILKVIWGPDIDAKSGFLASLAGGRTAMVFRGNKFGAEAVLKDAWEILATNDQDPKGRGRAKVWNTMGFLMDVVQTVGQRKSRK